MPALDPYSEAQVTESSREMGGESTKPTNPGGEQQQQETLGTGVDAAVESAVPESNTVIDPAVERRLRRKLDRTVLVLVFVAYLLAFLDRSNIGNAETAGMSADLGFDDAHFQWLLTIFYIPYILFEWCALMWKLVPPHIWAGITVLIWGLASTLQAVAFNWEGLMVCRWFMAMAEAAFAPGVPYLLSFFYRRTELGLRCGIYLSAAPLATTFAGALASAITSAQHTALAPWRLLFLVEGAPTILFALVIYLYLPDSPDTARFLTPAEKSAARARAVLQSGRDGRARLGRATLRTADLLATPRSLQTVLPALMYFSCNVSFASLPVFLPAVLRAMGFAPARAQGLTAPPYLFAFVVCIATTHLADRTRQRGLVIAALSAAAGAGYVLLATSDPATAVAARYAGVFLAAGGVFPAIANVLPWTLNNQGSDTRRGAGIAVLNLVGQCGPLLGTRLFPAADGPAYVRGMAVCAAFMFANAALALALRWHFARKNRALEDAERAGAEGDAHAGGRGKDAPTGAGQALSEMEGAVGYRYVL